VSLPDDLSSGAPSAEPPLEIGVLLFRGVEPLDAIGPAEVFWALEGVRPYVAPFRPVNVHLVAEAAGPVELAYGFVVHATVGYADCPPLDVLVVPGGSAGEDDDATARAGRRFYEHHEPTLAFVRGQARSAPIMASVCTGTFILAGAGLLAGRTVNTHWTARDELAAKMATRGEAVTIEAARVVDGGDVVTAGGVSSGIDLAIHVVGRVLGDRLAEAAALAIERETPVPVQ
jgi:transcriptional regulator GlxA family with amidase domain